jgi:hypothetical protein
VYIKCRTYCLVQISVSIFLTFIVLLCCFPFGLYGQTETSCNFVYVSASGSGNGTTPSSPTSITSALAATNTANFLGSVLIMLATGTYTISSTLKIPSNVILDGGYISSSSSWSKSTSATVLNIEPPRANSTISSTQVFYYIGKQILSYRLKL